MESLLPETPLARISASKDFRAEKRPRVRAGFMLPRWDEKVNDWALSTYRFDGLDDDQKRVFAEEWVRDHLGAGRTAKGHCELPVSGFESEGLEADFDNDPPRHVNVVGWPDDEAAHIAIAQGLCALIEEEGVICRYS